MLSEMFDMEWYKVHDEAERLEHAVSADFEAKLTEKLGRGGICPHGNQTTPETPTARKQRGLILLGEVRAGRVYTIRSCMSVIEGCSSSWKNVESGPDPTLNSRAAITTGR